jgi:hypothetical protein
MKYMCLGTFPNFIYTLRATIVPMDMNESQKWCKDEITIHHKL